MAQPANIFGAAAAGVEQKQKEKRTMLKNCDSIAAKALDPWGVSVLQDISLPALWNLAKNDDKYAVHFSNLAATEAEGGAYRVGIGLSQVA